MTQQDYFFTILCWLNQFRSVSGFIVLLASRDLQVWWHHARFVLFVFAADDIFANRVINSELCIESVKNLPRTGWLPATSCQDVRDICAEWSCAECETNLSIAVSSRTVRCRLIIADGNYERRCWQFQASTACHVRFRVQRIFHDVFQNTKLLSTDLGTILV